ncbi:hypothetical protein [Adhaeretor mobilis]|uniref:DUF3566 domain-containing protein n=1 Tax=Adhaeretor mobilis TaxID=1930276 RepID=A0A517MQD0_9BACT|nr:hypothetical protein [Adhaeretor mobilis]QDS97088.1 hypothetical protein HG15A2_03480 [Adhaeretor mobilis]
MMELKRVGVLSCGKISGLFGALAGLIAGSFMAFFMMVAPNIQMQGPNGQVMNMPAAAAGVGIGALIMAPIMYGIMGFIAGMFYGFVYNLLAGGIEMHFERIEDHYQPQQTYEQ